MADRLPRMIVSTEGEEGSGKSRFALTAPRPIGWLDFDMGLEGVDGADGVEADNHKVYDVSLAAWLDEAAAKRHTQAVMRQYLADFRKMIADGIRTIVTDTFTAAWRAQRVARADDRYAEMEEEFLGLIKAAYASSRSNVILIHHMKLDWKKTSDGKSYPAGTKSRDGMDGVLNAVQLGIRQRYVRPVPAQMAGTVVVANAVPGRFEIDVLKCRDNIGLVGATLPGMDFPTLCAMAAPTVDWSR